MTRTPITYTTRSRAAAVAGSVDVSQPVAGYYRMKLISGGVLVGIKLWYGPPTDPDTGEEMDRSWRWQAHANGRYIDFDRAWPKCTGDPVDEQEYRYLSSLQEWGERHAPTSPEANPQKRIDWLTAPLTI